MKYVITLWLVLLVLCGCSEAEGCANMETTVMMAEASAAEESVPATTVPTTTVVTEPPAEPIPDEIWFDDALFIGESRTAGLKGYGRLGAADYFCGEGLTVYGVMAIEASDENFTDQSLQSLFAQKQYSKIYIHLGINELGGNPESFVAGYQKVIDEIRVLQPDACIILQAVLALGEGYSTKPWFSRESIRDLNDRIRTLAEDNGLHFSDANQIMTNEEGYLIPEKTFDGCHLYPASYEEWARWLLEEAATLNIP